ncbi:filament integrity protein FraC [Brasilonema sp. UFV-L1]|uniref:filament integrity protein FraC n=1 Tax=Brasilonema sp. UFV-L1 TaxID=2234130 RepID=UPI00145E6338|nr:filament integrity protein FraC [Brasilonema sp. UFV-L1]NMG06060.1 filament integrity protein fraC [Brasilonema sp. UFV-L1]
MFEIPELSIPRIFPIGAILFNFLFLLVAIPLEAYVLNARLKFDKKSSAFYAISINVFSNAIGWVIFFFIEPALSPQVKSELMTFVFFNRLQTSIQTLLILTAFIIFFGTFLVKYAFLRILLISLSELKKPTPEPQQIPQRRNSRLASKNKWQNTNVVTTILIANALSYSLIAIILFIRSVNT